ncbi:MAG: zf-HC2 domain-containing protein [Pseudomonadota bacterium]|nr:zf-HC2 domain-containing protein [Pseudomonadota bacterium]
MNCQTVRDHLPDYLRGNLPDGSVLAVEQHLAGCPDCQAQLSSEQRLEEALARRHQAPQPSLGFEARVLAAATCETERRRSYAHVAWGGAVAAALVFGIWIGQAPMTSTPATDVAETPDVERTAADADERDLAATPFEPVVQTVRLAFTSAEPLEDVTLTLELPPHVELSGLPGEQRVSWQVSLQQGDNVLTLPLKVLFPGDGELIAELDAAGRQKVFRTSVPPFTDAGSGPRSDEEPST